MLNSIQLVQPLLAYVLSDAPRAGASAEEKKKFLRDLRGCPVLALADGSVALIPAQPRDAVAVASHAIHALVPQLKSFLVHPSVENLSWILLEPIARDLIYVDYFRASFLQVVYVVESILYVWV